MTDATATVTIREEPTLRDRFAMAALPVAFTNPDDGSSPDDLAQWCYMIADSMLRARKPKAAPAPQPSPLDAAVKRLEAWRNRDDGRMFSVYLCPKGPGRSCWHGTISPPGGGTFSGSGNLATAINAALDEAEKAGM